MRLIRSKKNVHNMFNNECARPSMTKIWGLVQKNLNHVYPKSKIKREPPVHQAYLKMSDLFQVWTTATVEPWIPVFVGSIPHVRLTPKTIASCWRAQSLTRWTSSMSWPGLGATRFSSILNNIRSRWRVERPMTSNPLMTSQNNNDNIYPNPHVKIATDLTELKKQMKHKPAPCDIQFLVVNWDV